MLKLRVVSIETWRDMDRYQIYVTGHSDNDTDEDSQRTSLRLEFVIPMTTHDVREIESIAFSKAKTILGSLCNETS